jgi:methyl-accepting chemotaxis protein
LDLLDTLFDLYQQVRGFGLTIIFTTFVIFVVAFVANLIIRNRYINILEDLLAWHRRKEGKFHSDILNKIVEDYKNTATESYSEVNTQAIIEKNFNLHLRILALGERFIKNSNTLLITLGLFGTFVGLTAAVAELSGLFIEMDISALMENAGIQTLIRKLIGSLEGMSVAFVTSLVGVGCSIILTILLTIFSAEEARENLMVQIEEYLDNVVALVVSQDKETEYSIMNNILRETFMEFGDRIQTSLQKTVEDFGDKLTTVVMDVNVSSQTLDNTIDKFDASLANFSSNMKDLNEFNINMRNNIAIMDVNFIKVTEALTKSTDIVASNYQSIENFSNNIREAADEMTTYNRQLVSDITQLVSEITSTVQVVENLSGIMDTNMQQHTRDLEIYQENFTHLMSMMNNEIKDFGKLAAVSFLDVMNKASAELGQIVSSSLEESLNKIFKLLDQFRENQNHFAKAIASLPDQVLTYNQAATAKIDRQLSELRDDISER